MTEQEWFACVDPQKMLELEFLEGKASGRKLRLFGCACCRQLWGLLREDCFRNAVEVAERFADGKASSRELAAAKKVSGAALERSGLAGLTGPGYCALGSAWSCTRNPQTAALYPVWVFTGEAQLQWEVLLLRDIFGNPFRAVTLAAIWLTPSVTALARSVYEDRDFDRLPILADALEEAGCDNGDILAHLRGPGPHALGCWALDSLLGKE
jgi:hypothetical protein